MFDELKALRKDPKRYSEKLETREGQKEAETFKKAKIEKSRALTNIALHHVNFDGPCHYDIQTDGIDEVEMFKKYMTWEKDAKIVQWMGSIEESPQKTFEQMLIEGVFDSDFKHGELTDVGVACACNPYYGMICDFIIAKNASPRIAMPVETFMPFYKGEECARQCETNEIYDDYEDDGWI